MRKLALAASIALAHTAALDAQQLLADLDPRPPQLSDSSDPAGFKALQNGFVLFSAADAEHGRELWRSDGTGDGTRLVRELWAGPTGSLPLNGPFAVIGGAAVFLGFDEGGYGTWRSDGTAAGTTRIASVAPPMSVDRGAWAFDGARLWWIGFLQSTGAELWASDGTTAGTGMVADIAPGPASAFPTTPSNLSVSAIGGGLWFAADTGATGPELWFSDGTAAGTRLVAELVPGPTGGDPRAAVAFGNRIVFVARSSLEPGARSLWISDATAAGTREIAPWSVGAYWPGDLAVVNGKVVYTGFSHVNGTEPFVSDGTAAGTGLLFDVNPGLATSSPGQFTVHGGVAYFTAYDPSSGTELWRTDATPQGTSRVADLAPGTRSSSPYELTVAYGALWFVAFDDAGTGQELWTTDGTASGTRLVVDLRPGTGSSSPSALTPIGNGFWFAANDGVHGREPFRSDRSAAGTVLVADLAATRFGSDPGAVRSTRLRAFLHATAPGVGREYFVTDGATAVPWRDAAPGIAWSGEAGLALDGDVAFWSQEGRLFRTDLLGAAPVTIAAVPGLGGNLARLPTGIAFGAGTALWVSDGNAAGTRLVLDFNRSIFYPAGPHAMESFRDGVLFLASEGQLSPNAGLWFSDGTLTGTRLLVPAQVGLGVGARVTTVVDGARVFAAVTANNRIALWISDGTSSTRLTDHTIQSVPARAMARLSSGVVFTGADGVNGAEPWISDGTPAGTRPLADLAPGGASSSPDQLTAAGRAVFFVADDGTHGRELFVTDGSSPGTRLVRDVVPGPASANPLELFAVGDGELVVCRMHEPGTGAEPWVSDGTAAGTRLLSDLRPGAASSSPAAFARLGRYLVFGANDGLVGREPFVLPLAGLGAHVAETFGAPCPGGSQARPRIAAGGAPVLGANSFGIELAAGRPASPSALLVAAEAGKLLVSGNCAIRAANPFVALSAATDAAGRASIPIAIALDRSLVGVELVTQWLVADPGGALLGAFAASAGLRVVVGS